MKLRTCKCMEKMRERWMKDNPEIKYVWFDMANIGGDATGQRLEVRSEVTKRDGSIREKRGKSFIAHNFCPWCGTKYNFN